MAVLSDIGGPFGALIRHRGLVYQLTRREVVGRYRGSVMGLLWSLFHPVLMLSVYTFVFGHVFKSRWGSGFGSTTSFAQMAFAGMIVYGLFSECVTRAPGLIVGNANFVKRVVFPLELLPWVTLFAAMFHALIGLGVLLLFSMFLGNVPTLTMLCFPLVLLPFACFVVGATWALAALGVYLRDLAQVTGVAVTVAMFLSPMFYPVSALPAALQSVMQFNPLTFPMEQLRAVMIMDQFPDWRGLAIYTCCAVVTAWVGFTMFQRLRRGFADVL
ncbi:ABC transporter permease [Cupriavidus sp.]|uniref:ABC transporter permease n=1 Tax=Cupriavidus sp. TaxID=1873897 RepID=UPI0031DE6F6A